VAVVKDVLSFFGAWGIVYQQVLVGPVDNRLLALALILLGVPGASAVLPRLLGVVGVSTSTTSPGSGSRSSDSRS
jgi:hypothetical protein